MPQIIKVRAGQRNIVDTPTKMQSAVGDRPQTILLSPSTLVPLEQAQHLPYHAQATSDLENVENDSPREEVNRTSVAY